MIRRICTYTHRESQNELEETMKVNRINNFNAGPAALPLAVLEEIQEGFLDFSGTGMSITEISHRSKEFDAIMDDTIARIVSSLEPEALLQCFLSWVNEIREHAELPVIAFDGKTLRHSFNGDRKTALHSVSAYAVEQGLVLAQKKSTGKKNEVATARRNG